MIPPEKPDIITLMTNAAAIEYKQYSVRMINCRDLADDATEPKNTGFMGTRSYPMSWQIGQTPMFHFLCDAVIRIMFDDNPEPQVLNLEIIGELGSRMIVAE
ncbi:MAG: hypothetical protein EZS28_019506 [Streblomastix strix]|uniref:Uncharacterized protein n=1 Tax=Streblomastix strix TaxID=222440 RepID=A0A5J4VRE1_9EUKA|nr:MAG: hypothetical protein EZS28_019506 [Streblomastix strix]